MIEESQLDKIWNKWVSESAIKLDRYSTGTLASLPKKYRNLHRRSPASVHFEEWLWGHGGRVTRTNKKLSVQFNSEQQAIMFILTNL